MAVFAAMAALLAGNEISTTDPLVFSSVDPLEAVRDE